MLDVVALLALFLDVLVTTTEYLVFCGHNKCVVPCHGAQQWDLFRARVTLGQRLVLVLAVAGLQPARQLSWCARVDMVHGATTGGA